MLSGLSSNAILSKARAMYGKRLTKENYNDLLNCQTVGEVASYLKSRTVYGKCLAGINESEVHRGQLEVALRQKLFDDYASLCRYEISVGEHFARYLIGRSEVEQILHSLMLLNAGTPEEYLFSMPYYLNRHTRIDLNALSKIKSFDGLLDALGHTPYRKLLESFRPQPGAALNYTAIENALYSYLFSEVFETIRRHTRGETAKQLAEIFNSYIDLINYVRIIRLKFSYHASPDFVRSSLLPFGSIKAKHLNAMLAADKEDEIEEIMGRTPVGKHFLKVAHTYIDEIPNRVKYITCKRDIRFSTHPSVVMMSYVFLSQSEITDIITIVECIRYQIPASEITKLLTIVNFE